METITYANNGETKEAIIVTADTDIAALLAPYANEDDDEYLSETVWTEGVAPLFEIKKPVQLVSKRAIGYCVISGQPDCPVFKVGENAYRFIRFEWGKQIAASRVYSKENFKRIGWERFTSNYALPKFTFQN